MPAKSPQHRDAHGRGPGLRASNKSDIASFVGGESANTPTGDYYHCVYYHCVFQTSTHRDFYYIMESTRRINRATLTYKGRKADIKTAKFRNKEVQQIYNAGVGSPCEFNEDLTQAIHKACNWPSYNKRLFEKAWELYPGSHRLHRPRPSRAQGKLIELPFSSPPSESKSPQLQAAMEATRLQRVDPGKTIVQELIHHSLLDIETGIVMRRPHILRAGMVVTSLAARLYRGRTDIFQRPTEAYSGPLIAFIMDMSGSMNCIWPDALAVMGAVAHTFNRARVSTICIGFSADEKHNHLYQFQDRDEAFDIDRFHIFKSHSGNADAVAVEYCRRQLLIMEQAYQESKKKYIVVFSDETPSGMTYLYKDRIDYYGCVVDCATLNETLNLCKKTNTATISALPGPTSSDRLMYDARILISNPESTLNSILEKMSVL